MMVVMFMVISAVMVVINSQAEKESEVEYAIHHESQ